MVDVTSFSLLSGEATFMSNNLFWREEGKRGAYAESLNGKKLPHPTENGNKGQRLKGEKKNGKWTRF